MEYSKEELNKLHETLVEMLDYVDDICKKHELEYFLNCGSVLGAVRHKGFIPWDDDIDIMLPRDSYDKFISIIKDSKMEKYSIQNEETEKNYYLLFSKLRKRGTTFLEMDSQGLYSDNGIYIDVFPLDFSDEIHSVSFKINELRIRLIQHGLKFRYSRIVFKRTRGKIGYIVSFIAAIPYMIISKKYLMNKANKLMRSRNNKKHNYIISYGGIYGIKKEAMPYDIYYPINYAEFEGKEYPVCNNLDAYLRNYYGNYKELPPEDKRHTHLPLKLEF